MKQIQILGPGCAKCKTLAERAERAATDLGIQYTIEKVTDINDIIKFKIWQTPGLVIDGEVKSSGKVMAVEDIKKLLVP